MADHLCDWSTITQKWSENGQWLDVISHTARMCIPTILHSAAIRARCLSRIQKVLGSNPGYVGPEIFFLFPSLLNHLLTESLQCSY